MARRATHPLLKLCISCSLLRPALVLRDIPKWFSPGQKQAVVQYGTQLQGDISTPGSSSSEGVPHRDDPHCQLKLRNAAFAGKALWVSMRSLGELWSNTGAGQHGTHVCLSLCCRTIACWGGESQLGASAARRIFLVNACKVSEETAPGKLCGTVKSISKKIMMLGIFRCLLGVAWF